MTDSPTADTNTPSSWFSAFSAFSSFSLCCAPLAPCLGRKPRRSKFTPLTTSSISWPVGRTSDQDLLIDQDEKPSQPVVRDQPALQSRPVVGEMGKFPRKSFASSRTVSTMKKRFGSDGSATRPQISAPSDFRHVESGSFQFPPSEPTPLQLRQDRLAQPSSFRPLELSYRPSKHMSPILPWFEFPDLVPPPPPAHLQERLHDDHQLIHQSSSSTPFHLPRKVVAEAPSLTTSENGRPATPARPQARPRAHTSPELEAIKARVAGAMIEVERLQKQIDDVVERQSIYACSRPSTSLSMARTMPELEPMPSIPALPPSAPSFAERLNLEIERPQTAPLKTEFEISNRSQEFGDGKGTTSALKQAQYNDPRLPPPLPLVLRPPLRKKKSFSRVSTWLFPSDQHNRDLSLDSITNLPRPVKGTEGFYQCVALGNEGRRSFDSVGTVTTWDSEEEQRTVPTTLSPQSTPTAKHDALRLERTATFGKGSTVRPNGPLVEAMS